MILNVRTEFENQNLKIRICKNQKQTQNKDETKKDHLIILSMIRLVNYFRTKFDIYQITNSIYY